jgi:hypothetical protein
LLTNQQQKRETKKENKRKEKKNHIDGLNRIWISSIVDSHCFAAAVVLVAGE